jgi:hypothetical protein
MVAFMEIKLRPAPIIWLRPVLVSGDRAPERGREPA